MTLILTHSEITALLDRAEVHKAVETAFSGLATGHCVNPAPHALSLPAEGAAILAGNHLSYADWLFTPLALNRRVTFVAKSDYFTGVGVKGWAQKRFFAGTGQVPIDRSGGRASEGALRAGLQTCQRGNGSPRRGARVAAVVRMSKVSATLEANTR